jgi:hypothetical protein
LITPIIPITSLVFQKAAEEKAKQEDELRRQQAEKGKTSITMFCDF